MLFYNSQVTDDLTARLQKVARESKVPVVGVSETEPPNTSYRGVDAAINSMDLDKALAGDGT